MRGPRAWLAAAALVAAAAPPGLAAPVADADAEGDRPCLPSRGADPATPPAVRLAGVWQFGNSGDLMRDMMAGTQAAIGGYVPGGSGKATGPARWLFDGVADAMAGRHDAARQQFERCIAEATQARDALVEAACRNNQGAVAALRGGYAEARAALDRAAEIYRAEAARLPGPQEMQRRRKAMEARMATQVESAASAASPAARSAAAGQGPLSPALLETLRRRGEQAQAEAMRDPQMLAVMRDMGLQAAVQTGLEIASLNQGNVAFALGQWEESLAHLKAALEGQPHPRSCRPAALDDLLRLRERLPRPDEVSAVVERHRRAQRGVTEPANGFPYEVGSIALTGSGPGPAGAVAAATTATPGVGRPARSGASASDPVFLADPLGATSETVLQDLLAQATREERAGQAAQARRSYAAVALRAHAGQRGEIEAAAQAALMRLEAAAGRPAVAIFHGKRAANRLQELRAAGAPLERNARRSYLRQREQTYGQLAQLLMQAQRLPEAERVLQMLKEDEGRQFIDGAGSSATAGRVRLPETGAESAQRGRLEQAAASLRRADDERSAVAADRTWAMLLSFDRARIERDRLEGAAELHELLQPRGSAGPKLLDQRLRSMPREVQQAFLAQLADGGQRLAATLRGLAEDAPRFQATPAQPHQLAAIAETLRRLDEVRGALAPTLEAMRRAPSPTMAQMLEPAFLARESQRQSQQRSEQMMASLGSLSGSLDLARLVSQGTAGDRSVQRAVELAATALAAAAAGREDHATLDQVEPALRGASPVMLDAFVAQVRSQGQSLGAPRPAGQTMDPRLALLAQAQSAYLQNMRQQLAGQGDRGAAIAAFLDQQERAAERARSESRAQRRTNPQEQTPATASGSAAPSAAVPGAGTSVLARVQSRLEDAAARVRATAGPASRDALASAFQATLMPQQPQERSSLEPPAAAIAEPLARLWRIEQSRSTQEARAVDLLAQSAAALETAREPLPAQPDDSPAVLARLPVPTALLYYLPHDTAVDVLLVTAQGRRTWRLPVPRAELDRRIGAFTDVLRDASRDARGEAGALHALLFAPVADALAQARTEVVALSVSGRLRFVPFAALHDGQRWLAERHAFAVYPGGPLADLLKPASGRWQVAAFGASRGGAGLSALPAVPQELGMVVRQAPGSGGALPGRRWLDGDFTAQSLRAALSGAHQVVHIASHFKFEPGDAAGSFLLLGNGERLSLQALTGRDYRFDRTELVTLSACQTGLSADDAYGQEVDGLAALLMAQGAPSVLASLWQVADGSTALLMGTMYSLHEQRPLARALALQQAQVAMIRGTPLAAAGARAVAQTGDTSRGIGRPQDTKPGGGAATGGGLHPYHWAAFVLMGSWL